MVCACKCECVCVPPLQGIVIIGATNRKDVLDAALTRAGRFDRSIEVRRPNYQGRLEGVQVRGAAQLPGAAGGGAGEGGDPIPI